MKNFDQLSKNGKVELIKAIANGDLKPDDITPETRFICSGDDLFVDMVITANHPELKVITIGQARESEKTLMEGIQQRREKHREFEEKINQIHNENTE